MPEIVIIGGGNMATQLCKTFFDNDHPIDQVYNRTLDHAIHLRPLTNKPVADQISKVNLHADLYLLCISDGAISQVAKELISHLANPNAVIAHTSGSTPSSLLGEAGVKQYGAFYPLQSLRKERLLSLSEVPILISGNKANVNLLLKKVASLISKKVIECEDDMRSRLHLPAVIVNNFVNYLYSAAFDYCTQENLPFEYLHALMSETTKRITDGYNPDEMQTGPAIRNDIKTINRHIDQLNEYHEYKKLYIYLTNKIKSHHSK